MQALRLNGIEDAAVERVPDPIPEAGECVIQPIFSGLCGSDVHAYKQGALVKGYPVTMGHELVGRVVSLGPRQREVAAYGGRPGLNEGDTVVVEPLLPCGACVNCTRGMPNICLDWSHIGFLQDGCWADYVALPTARAARLDEDVSVDQAGLVEPVACALNFIDKSGLRPGMSLLVLGGGPAGLLTLQVAAAGGATPLILSEPNPTRRELAARLGAQHTVDPLHQDLGAICRDLTAGVGPEIVVEVTGNPAAVAQAIDVVRPGGTVVLAGICGARRPSIDSDVVMLKELNVRGALASRWHFARSMRLIAGGTVDVRAMVSGYRPWQDAIAAMAEVEADPQLCKILFTHGAGGA